MDQNKEVLRKLGALFAFLAIAASVFFFAPPASRLFVALIALPIESLILVSLFSDNGRRSIS